MKLKLEYFALASFCAVVLVVVLLTTYTGQQRAPQISVQPTLTPAPTAPDQPSPTPTPASYALIVRVLQAHNQQPLPAAHVLIKNQANQEQIATRQTGPNGEIALQRSSAAGLIVSATHDDFFAKTDIRVNPGESKTLTLTLHQKRAFIGNVVNANQAPIPNATIALQLQDEANETGHSSRQAVSDASGAFRFFPVRSGVHIVQATHPGYLPYINTVHINQQPLEIVLRRKAQLLVKTVDEQHQPVSGADVQLTRADTSQGIFLLQESTNARGAVRFSSLQPRRYQIGAQAPFSAQPASHQVDLTTTGEQEVTLTLRREEFTVSGHVLDSRTSQGIVSATVVCEPQMAVAGIDSTTHRVTGSEGFYEFKLPVGKYKFYVDRVPGYISGNYAQYNFYGTKPASILAQFVDEDITGYDFHLNPAWTLKGRIFGPNSSALPGGEVYLRLVYMPDFNVGRTGSRTLGKSVAVKADGSYEIQGEFTLADQGAYVRVYSDHPEYRKSSSEPATPAPGDIIDGLNITHDTQYNITGKVQNHRRRRRFLLVQRRPG